jgi:ubiquinone/menaquinone biosynthesis C-methylase UbiE
LDQNYREIVNQHYQKQAKEIGLDLKSTMPDQNIRELEITNIIKYLNDGDNCLELGCGNGAASIEIAKKRKLSQKSIDYSKEMIELANKQNRSEIKGDIEFEQGDILDLKNLKEFDVVFTVRCIINLMDKNDQRKALDNLAKLVKSNGKLILLEAFSDGLEEINMAREELGLESIPPAHHNLHLVKNDVINYLKNSGMELLNEDCFLSSYYFWTRAILPALVKANNVGVKFNSKIDSYFKFLTPYGNFSHIKLLVFKKIE